MKIPDDFLRNWLLDPLSKVDFTKKGHQCPLVQLFQSEFCRNKGILQEIRPKFLRQNSD